MNRAHRPSRVRLLPAAMLATLAFAGSLGARKFYDDDPLGAVPPPLHVESVRTRRVSDYYDFFANTLGKRGEQNSKKREFPARGVNTLGEVPDSVWYTNRHDRQRMSLEDLARGPGNENAPDTSGPLTVIRAKTEGVTPGFTMRDARGRIYIVKFDPLTNPEMATAADVLVSKIFHALGYNVPENHIFHFSRDQVRVGEGTTVEDSLGRPRPMNERDVTELLLRVPRAADGRIRAVGSLLVKGKFVGEFRYHGTRADDPNDVVPHEHRRDLRGLGVFCAWIGHDDSRAINTADFLMEENGRRFIRHYLIDFGSTLGSASIGPNSPRSGQYMYATGPALVQMVTLGLYIPRWARANYPDLPSVGRFEWETFDPETWVPEYRNPAFVNRLPDDAFWAARQVMGFTDEEIRAIVRTGQYSDSRAENWIVECLIRRRDKIGRAFFSGVLPLDRFEVKDGKLVFEDLAVKHGFLSARNYTVQWSRFDNESEQKSALAGATSFDLPREILDAAPGSYAVADIAGDDPKKTVSVYLRKRGERFQVVGIERGW
jgi:hypothetical protein